MKKFKVFYGLAGGFGGANDNYIVEAENEDEAEDMAFESACEKYENYAGRYGLKSWYDVLESLNNYEYKDEPLSEDNDEDVEIVNRYYDQARESWLAYYVEEIIECE